MTVATASTRITNWLAEKGTRSFEKLTKVPFLAIAAAFLGPPWRQRKRYSCCKNKTNNQSLLSFLIILLVVNLPKITAQPSQRLTVILGFYLRTKKSIPAPNTLTVKPLKPASLRDKLPLAGSWHEDFIFTISSANLPTCTGL